MNGFKTIVGMIVLGIISPALVKHGFPALTPDEQTAVTAAILSGAAVALRCITTTPIFSSLRAWLAARKIDTDVSPAVLQAIAAAVAKEIQKQPAPTQEKTV